MTIIFHLKICIVILAVIAFVILLHKKKYLVESYDDPQQNLNKEADLADKLAVRVDEQAQVEYKHNTNDLMQDSTYLNNLNDILSNKLDMADDTIMKALKNLDANEINFQTKNDGDKEGGLSICNTRKGVKDPQCSYLPHPNGNVYLRPGRPNGGIVLEKADNVLLSSSNSVGLTSKNINILATDKNSTTNLCTQAMCSHLPYSDGNTYIRPGVIGGSVHIGNHGQNVANVTLNAKSTDICNSVGGTCSHFPWAGDNNTYIRGGTYNNNITLGEAKDINFQANQYIFKNKDGSNSIALSADDFKKIKATAYAPAQPAVIAPAPVVNNQIIKAGSSPGANAKSGNVNFGYTFANPPVVISGIDDNIAIPSGYQQMSVSRTGFSWTTSSNGGPYRTVKWVAIGN